MLKQDSIRNAQDIAAQLALTEASNFKMTSGGTQLALFADGPRVMTQRDEASFETGNDDVPRKAGFTLLHRRRELRQTIRKKVNVVAFANLVVDQPDKLTALLEELLRNSGRLVAQLALNRNKEGLRDAARNIVVDFLNKNIERIAGGSFGFAQPVEPPLQVTLPQPPGIAFQENQYLYINTQLAFAGRDSLVNELTTYLNNRPEKLYVFINYSQDVSTESFLARSPNARPLGLPEGKQFVVLTVVNIPGSVKVQIFGSRAVEALTASTTKNQPIEFVKSETRFPTDLAYVTPSGEIFRFKAGDGKLSSDAILIPAGASYPVGSLPGFRLNGVEYVADLAGGKFNGYKSGSTVYAGQVQAGSATVNFVHATRDCRAALIRSSFTAPTNPDHNIAQSFSYTVPPATVLVTIKNCTLSGQGEIPLASPLQGASGVVLNYTHDSNGEKLITEAEYNSLLAGVSASDQRFDTESKVYLINRAHPEFAMIVQQAKTDPHQGKQIYYLERQPDGKVSVALDMDFGVKLPVWMTSVFPNSGGNDCMREYIQTGLTSLHESGLYQNALLPHRIMAEYFTVVYRGIFGGLYCATSEETLRNASGVKQYFGGAFHEVVATVDVVQMIDGVITMAKAVVSSQVSSYTSFIGDVRQTIDDIAHDRAISNEEMIRRLLPPPVRMATQSYSSALTIAGHMVTFYITDCSPVCAYRAGQLTVVVVPIIITLGEYAVVKGGALMARVRALKNGSRSLDQTDNVANLLKESQSTGKDVASDAEKIVVKEPGSENVVATVEKRGDEVVITRARTLADRLNDFKGIQAKIDGFNDLPKRQHLLDDFANATDDVLYRLDAENGRLVDSWKVLQADEILRKSSSDLEVVAKYLEANPGKLDEITEEFSRASNKLDYLGNKCAGIYTTKIKWGRIDIDARPVGDKGYWGTRITQSDARVDAFERKINPNNESFYVQNSEGSFVQFENIRADALQDGKLIQQVDNSIYHVYDKPEFLRENILKEALRQVDAAKGKGLKVDWLVSDQRAVDQLRKFFSEKNIDIEINLFAE